MKNRIVFVLLLFVFISCKQKVEEIKKVDKIEEVNQDDVITMNTMTTNYDTLIYRIKTEAIGILMMSYFIALWNQLMK